MLLLPPPPPPPLPPLLAAALIFALHACLPACTHARTPPDPSYQPLALATLWPVTPSLVDRLDEAGRIELENLRSIVAAAVVRLGDHLTPSGSTVASVHGRMLGDSVGRIASGREAVAEKEGADVEALAPNARRLLQKINVR